MFISYYYKMYHIIFRGVIKYWSSHNLIVPGKLVIWYNMCICCFSLYTNDHNVHATSWYIFHASYASLDRVYLLNEFGVVLGLLNTMMVQFTTYRAITTYDLVNVTLRYRSILEDQRKSKLLRHYDIDPTIIPYHMCLVSKRK